MSELLAPAGDTCTARAALLSGADAVYLGLARFSARDSAVNFSTDELSKTVKLAHLLHAKVYVCLNTLIKDSETEEFFSACRAAWNAGADAILIQDLFLGKAVKELYPEIVLHLSTQAGCCNEWGASLAKEFGFSRVVLARETALSDIRKISKIIETEAFVQGALCACFSGQCYLSSFAGNNSGNRGRCKQPCRKLYSIDRKGFETPAYALSLSDLSVGTRVSELLDAGVVSLKIEGRMRRPEYVAAAVKYYRAILDGKPQEEAFSRLKRAYNRGDYTAGLAFGEKNFLSRNVQGHIGEEVGKVSLRQGKYFCKSAFSARQGDGFKILRGKKEVGGAQYLRAGEGGFYLSASERLQAGDVVRVTTDTLSNQTALIPEKTRHISVTVRLFEGEYPYMACGDYVLRGGEAVPSAQSRPLTKEEITACFCKTDDLPISAEVQVETKNAFLPKSALNALRREFYAGLVEHLAPARTPIAERRIQNEPLELVQGSQTAVITAGGCEAEIQIIKSETDPKRGGHVRERYLYLPPYLTGEDVEKLKPRIAKYDGIYCEGYYGVALSRALGVPLFAGVGFNLSNAYAVQGVLACAKYFVLSKELSDAEQARLSVQGAFALSAGAIKVMDLMFCPFSRTCTNCDRRDLYTLTDEAGRQFPLRRYGPKGKCRFELYNCAPLAAYNGKSSVLVDCSLTDGREAAEAVKNARTPENVRGATGGHRNRSMQ